MHRCFNLLRPPEATLSLEHHNLAFPLNTVFSILKKHCLKVILTFQTCIPSKSLHLRRLIEHIITHCSFFFFLLIFIESGQGSVIQTI